MKTYKRHRYPPQIISHTVWLYHRFTHSFRDVEEIMASRGVIVSYAKSLRKKQGQLGDQWFLDEVFIKINGKQHYLWRAVDQDNNELDILVAKKRHLLKAKHYRFFRDRAFDEWAEVRCAQNLDIAA